MRWCAFTFLGIARCDQNSQTDPNCRTSLDVAHFVSQDRGLNRIKVKVGHGLQYHTRVGLAPRMIAAVLADAMEGVIRAVVHATPCVPLQSVHTSIASSLHRPTRRNGHDRFRTGW